MFYFTVKMNSFGQKACCCLTLAMTSKHQTIHVNAHKLQTVCPLPMSLGISSDPVMKKYYDLIYLRNVMHTFPHDVL